MAVSSASDVAGDDSGTGLVHDPAALARVLREARQASGLSIRRVAERAGVHHAGLARFELGERRPTPETLARLATALELDEAELFALAGFRSPEGLPSFPTYLRTKYRLNGDQAAELAAHLERLIADGDAGRGARSSFDDDSSSVSSEPPAPTLSS